MVGVMRMYGRGRTGPDCRRARRCRTFSHQQGTLALCRDELTTARQLLEHALDLREQHGDHDGATITRHNLQILQPSPPALPKRPARSLRQIPVIAGSGLIAVVALTIGVVKAATTTPAQQQPASVSTPRTPSPISGQPSGGSPGTTGTGGTNRPGSGGGTHRTGGNGGTHRLTQAQYETYAAWFANARRLRALAAELEALSLKEMARAEGWAKITPGAPAPPRTRPVGGPNRPKTPKPPKTLGDQPA